MKIIMAYILQTNQVVIGIKRNNLFLQKAVTES